MAAELKGRLARLNVRSNRWALWLGEVLGTFRGCGVAVELIRYPKRDVWNPTLGCATAGAVLCRNRKFYFVGLRMNKHFFSNASASKLLLSFHLNLAVIF